MTAPLFLFGLGASSPIKAICLSSNTCKFKPNTLTHLPKNYCPLMKMCKNMNWPHFTKLAVSRLIMVRFSKFKIWHSQEHEPHHSEPRIPSRATVRAKSRHARDDVQSDIILHSNCMTSAVWSAKQSRHVIRSALLVIIRDVNHHDVRLMATSSWPSFSVCQCHAI